MVLPDAMARLLRLQGKRPSCDGGDGTDTESTCSTDAPTTVADEALSDCDTRSIASDEETVEVAADSSRKTVSARFVMIPAREVRIPVSCTVIRAALYALASVRGYS
jgi:hypothetical protein